MVSVQHDFESPLSNTGSQVLYQRSILVQRMNRPSPSEFLRYSFAESCSAKGNHSQRNWSPLSHFAVGFLEFLGRRKKTRVIITDTEIHGSKEDENWLYL